MPDLPTGTITFLFTDIEGSTRLWEHYPEAMRIALARHDALMRTTIEQYEGHIFKTMGDAFCAAFHTASNALKAALQAQLSLAAELWPEPIQIKVRMALHTGVAEVRENDYFGPTLNRVARVLSAGHGGQVLLSQTAYDLTRDALPAEVNLLALGEHQLRDLNRPESLFQLLHSHLPFEFPPLKSLDQFLNNLPQQLTSFIGREKESIAINTLLTKSRLLTLTGAGGCGKTRLSLQVAADLLEQYPDGVWLVELAALADPGLVPQKVASTLGLKEQPGMTFVQALTDYLKSRCLLLVLDNCEHVLWACAELCNALLRTCPQLTILASSREGLNIAGEQTYRVPSLSLPDPDHPMTVDQVIQFESVRLFIERAVNCKSDFVVTNASAPALAAVCYRLDGIPLAIELAAARVRSLSVEEINTRLDNRFLLLTRGSKSALPRQQTLKALIDWSYDLLAEQEKLLLDRLAAFAGGWNLAAAEQVCAGKSEEGEEIEDWEVLDLLTTLVDKSLVIAESKGETTRYRLLETVRQYAWDRLAEDAGQLRNRRLRHRDYFLGLAEQARPHLLSSEQARWLRVLEAEHDNLRQALRFCQEDPESGEVGLRLAGVLGPFWGIGGHVTEGCQYLEEALAHAGAQSDTSVRATVLNAAGATMWMQGDFAAARSYHEQSLAIYRRLGNRSAAIPSLINLGLIARVQADYEAATALLEEALMTAREVGNKHYIADCLQSLAAICLLQRNHDSARSFYKESLSLNRELGNRWGIAVTLGHLGVMEREQGDFEAACALYEECLTIQQELGDKRGIAASLQMFANLAYSEQQHLRAARLSGAESCMREAIGVPRLPEDQNEYDQLIARVRAVLGETAFAASFAEGMGMTLEQAIEYALADRNA